MQQNPNRCAHSAVGVSPQRTGGWTVAVRSRPWRSGRAGAQHRRPLKDAVHRAGGDRGTTGIAVAPDPPQALSDLKFGHLDVPLTWGSNAP